MRTTEQYGKQIDLALGMWVKLARASQTFARITHEDIRSYGLTAPQFGVLESLGHLGKISLGELSRKQLSSGGNITVVVDNLAKEGLVERKPCAEDRRVIYAALTPKGKRLFDRIFATHAECVVSAASVLERREQEELSRLLRKLGQGLAERVESGKENSPSHIHTHKKEKSS